MMKVKFSALSAAVALALVAGQANATIDDGRSSGNGEMFLTAYDSVTQVSYTRDLGITINNFLANTTTINGLVGNLNAPVAGTYAFGATPTAAAGSVLDAGYSLTFQADPLFTSTFASSNQANIVWSVAAEDVNGVYRFYSTSNDDITQAGLTNNTLKTGMSAAQFYLAGANALGTHPTQANGSNMATPADQTADAALTFQNNWSGNVSFNSSTGLGQSQNFWMVYTVGTATQGAAGVTAYTGKQFTLNADGTLIYASAAAVPEPETWGMFGAGILAIGAMARRRMRS